ncbi:MAG: hypothetical protein IJ709_14005 [Selenomonas sp.]|nr:hypothetical protein [Selenomonas sp.]
MLECITIPHEEHPVRVTDIDGERWVVMTDLLKGLNINTKLAGRTIQCIPSTMKKQEQIKGNSSGQKAYFLLYKGCKGLLKIYKNHKNADFVDWVEKEVLAANIKPAAETVETKAKEVTPVKINDTDFDLKSLEKVLADNQQLAATLIEKLAQVNTTADNKTVDKLDSYEGDKIYYLPAKRNKWRLWINRVVDKLAIKYSDEQGDARIAAGKIWNALYAHIEQEFDFKVKEMIREFNSTASRRNHIKSRLALVDRNVMDDVHAEACV